MRLLGSGGFADVYLAEHIHLGYPVAIKFLHPNLNKLDNQFSDEARLVAKLQHPHIIRLMDFGIESSPYLVMEYAAGGTLRGKHPRGAVAPLSLIARYVEQIASALQYVHDLRIIHRDIKPDNILLRADSTAALSDFGIVAIMHTMQTHASQDFQGTFAYAAPEQLADRASPASDQYSLGVVVYELLSGHLPFMGPNMQAWVYQHVYVQPRPLRELVQDISPDVEAIVMRTLAKDPRYRFANVSDFAASLSQAVEATRISEQQVWQFSEIGRAATSFDNRETAKLTSSLQETTVINSTGSQAEEVIPTAAHGPQQKQDQEGFGSPAREFIINLLGVLTFLAGLPTAIYIIYRMGNYLDAVEGSQIQSDGLPRSNHIFLLHLVVGFVFAVVYTIYLRMYFSDGFGETNGFGGTAYALCGSTAAAEATALALMVIYPALLGGTPPTTLDWKVFGITVVVFIIVAILAAVTNHVSHRNQSST